MFIVFVIDVQFMNFIEIIFLENLKKKVYINIVFVFVYKRQQNYFGWTVHFERFFVYFYDSYLDIIDIEILFLAQIEQIQRILIILVLNVGHYLVRNKL